jgi:hypothetical protein
MPRRNSNAGSGTECGGGIQHGGRAQTGMGDNQCQNIEYALHAQWDAYMRDTTSGERRKVRRNAA